MSRELFKLISGGVVKPGSSYHPQSQGKIEVPHAWMKTQFATSSETWYSLLRAQECLGHHPT